MRGLASAALAAVGDAHAADALLPALLRSLDFAKAPRAKTGVLAGEVDCLFAPPQLRAAFIYLVVCFLKTFLKRRPRPTL